MSAGLDREHNFATLKSALLDAALERRREHGDEGSDERNEEGEDVIVDMPAFCVAFQAWITNMTVDQTNEARVASPVASISKKHELENQVWMQSNVMTV